MPVQNTACGIQSSISLWVLTGGSQFALFITVNVVITFLAIFDGIIILFALATDWFDVSGFYLSFWDSVENFLDLPKCKELCISAFFLSEWKKYLTFCHGMVTICSFYKCFVVVRHAAE